jgi:hypothetical protein
MRKNRTRQEGVYMLGEIILPGTLVGSYRSVCCRTIFYRLHSWLIYCLDMWWLAVALWLLCIIEVSVLNFMCFTPMPIAMVRSRSERKLSIRNPRAGLTSLLSSSNSYQPMVQLGFLLDYLEWVSMQGDCRDLDLNSKIGKLLVFRGAKAAVEACYLYSHVERAT